MSDEYKLKVKLEKGLPRTAAWIGILNDDTVRLEGYEWDSEIYGDHASYYDVLVEHKPKLFKELSDHVGQKINSDDALISALASTFKHEGAILDWLRKTHIPLKEHWAYV